MIYYGDPPCADTLFLGFADSFPLEGGSQRSKNGGVVKTLRRSNSLSRSNFSTAGSFGCKAQNDYKIIGNRPAPYRGLSASRPKCRKSLENVSWGLRPQDPKKSPKSPGTLQKHSPNTFRRLSGDFPDCPRDFFETFCGPGPEAPRDIFETLSAFRVGRPERPL